MKSLFKKMLCLVNITCVYAVVNAQVIDSTSQNGYQIKTFHSEILNENRKIRIQTPPGMKSYDACPVLYLLDGEAFMEMAGGQVSYLSESYKIIPSLIIVGIENTDRTRDLTPTHSIIGPDGKPDTSAKAFGKTSGGGEKFLQFITKELMPYIDSHYPTAPYKILSGHSLGGLMAVYCLVNHPDYFNAYIAISPSLQWDDQVMLKQVAQLGNKKITNRILFFSDANEDPAFHQNQISLDSLLKQKNLTALKYKRSFYPEETHISEPVKALYDGIRFIYPSWHLPYNSSAFKKTMSSKLIKDHFTALSTTYGYTVIPPHDDMILVARFLRKDSARIKDAIEILEMEKMNFSKSAVLAETLGDTYLIAGDKSQALKNFREASLLAPGKTNLAEKIKELEKK